MSDTTVIDVIAKDIYHGRIILPPSHLTDHTYTITEYLDMLTPKAKLSKHKGNKSQSDFEFGDMIIKMQFIKAWVTKRYNEFEPIWLPFFNTYFKGKVFQEVFIEYLQAKPFL